MMSKFVIDWEIENGIARITLNRPQTANALSLQVLSELKAALEECRNNKLIRCVILTGSGKKVFCAGADLKERSDMNQDETRRAVTLIRDTMNQLEALPQPVIAAVNGVALGGGTEMALACDLRIASETAVFGLTETSLGIIPGAGGTQRLPRLIGKGRAKELIYTAKRIDAKEALEIGLVEYVTSAESLIDKAYEIAKQIERNAPIAISQAKFSIDRGYDVDLQTGIAIEKNAYEITIGTSDRLEGLKAFKEKRRPVFKGE
jgi:methylglutaconyl-CoA hydratase